VAEVHARFVENGLIELVSKEEEVIECGYHFFNNTFNSFVLFFPKGEHQKSKVKVVFKSEQNNGMS